MKTVVPITNPLDLLPIPNPAEYEPEDPKYFYENVAKHLITDFLRIEENGIPIDLNKVEELEEVLQNSLNTVYERLEGNVILKRYLEEVSNKNKHNKIKELTSKEKTYEDFLKEYNPKNKIHKSYVINTYLKSIDKESMCMNEWSKKDIIQLNQLYPSVFLNNLLDNSLKEDNPIILEAMKQLAEDKCRIYNQNKIQSKIESVRETNLINTFNPGSSTQIRDFFKFYGIESEQQTPKGSPKFNRNELKRIQKLLEVMIEE
jgi:hypothetical protein